MRGFDEIGKRNAVLPGTVDGKERPEGLNVYVNIIYRTQDYITQ